jgi:phosphoglycerate dehydrogenase-like enzyme
MSRPRVAVLMDTVQQRRVLDEAGWAQLRERYELRRCAENRPLVPEELADLLSNADAAISGWRVVRLDESVLAPAERLRFVAHSAGSVKGLVSDAFWAREIRITSAAAGIAEDVALSTVALIHLGVKKWWPFSRWVRGGGWLADAPFQSDEVTGKTVGVIGASHVGRRVVQLLPTYKVGRILLYDPYVTAARAAELGAESVELDDLMRLSDVVTCHAPMTAETRHMLDARRLRLLKNGAVLVNTSRGWNVDETALIAELRTGRIFAFLDVTDPEPPTIESDLRRLDNVVLTPHISGSMTQCQHLGRMAIEELRRHFAGEAPVYEVKREMLARIG